MPDTTDCSPERPWGRHPEIVDSLCSHCGWSADSRPQPQVDPERDRSEPAAA